MRIATTIAIKTSTLRAPFLLYQVAMSAEVEVSAAGGRQQEMGWAGPRAKKPLQSDLQGQMPGGKTRENPLKNSTEERETRAATQFFAFFL